MNWFTQLFSRTKIYDDLSEEVAQHIDERTDELLQSGLTRQQASAQARREFGNVTSLKEEGRETWQWPRLESFLSDIRYAFRQLRLQPSFAVVAILILAIGIGANVAVFSVVNTLVLEPLPLRDADRLAWIINTDSAGLSGRTHQVATYEALAQMNSFEETTAYEAFFARSSYKLTDDKNPDRVMGVMVAKNFFPFLSVSPLLGRTFTEEESALNGPGAVILSYDLWQRRYAADPDIIGHQLMMNDQPATIVGVMPRTFDFGDVFSPGARIDLYVPAVFDVIRTWGNTLSVMGRLREGITLAAAQAEANSVIERQQREHPEFGPPRSYGAMVQPFRNSVVGSVQRPMLLLWAAVGLVLLIVCVNLSNLLLARATTRRKEMALRGAIGAGQARLARQLLTESFVLASIGGGLGIGLAFAAIAYVRQLEGLSIPLLKNIELDGGVLTVALGVTVLTALLFGLVPTIDTMRGDLGTALKDSGRGSSEGRDHRFVRSSLVVSEVALACLLLIGAGLLLRSFLHVLDVDLGFNTEQTYSLRVDVGVPQNGEQYRARLRALLAAAQNAPGVESASFTDAVPLEGNRSWWVTPSGRPDDGTDAIVKLIGPGLLETMGTPLQAGREFLEQEDGENNFPVVLVNETLAQRLWPNQDPLSQSVQVIGANFQVVGVVADVRHLNVEESSGPEFYLPILQIQSFSPDLIVHTSQPFAAVAPGLRKALAEVAPDMPTAGFRPLQQNVDRAVSPRRFFVSLLMAFAGAALLLAAIGIYGVIAYSVARRTPEIGIRMALGATAGRVRASVVNETLRLTLIGVAVGLGSAAALTSFMTSLLYDVSPSDPWTFAAAAAILLLVAAAAGFIPAARAARISPISALRTD